ncbi:MAG: hypothetical protein AB7D16_12535 [Eubacteriaceae bacterium]|jgi:hypothetical protein
MILKKNDKDQKKKQLCEICHKKPATTTIQGHAGVVKVCQECKNNVRI